ncbi:metal ABC transporter permease [Cardinium endosymbiont of Oedothorax gibbosus]|uniref:metal ABC transporter permease n=1 Tax=Cardinium endosymbiont of Oedothorax gibbosus TaxID=931101 RepID=UPI002024C370|nr:metal ABC transporter permease [Cardinium endosymbiont of Oedothorax gibbosus]CAH2560230.1 Putative Manganese transport system membrane protein MntD [Cardinium endosymbiont of Oedothorax gibbosus]
MDVLWTIIIAALASINCALVGTYLVLRKIAMMGDAIAHSTLPGIVLALLITGSKNSPVLIAGAGITGLLVTFLIAFLEKKISIQADAAIGINFTFLFALGVILISFFSRKIDLDPECSLYGELATVPLDLWRTASGINLGPKAFYILLTALSVNVTFLIMGYKQLFVSTFDPQFAQSIGVHTTRWHYCLMAITSLTTVSAFEVAGAILVVALLIVPAASIYLVTKCLKRLLFYNILFAILTSISGYYISFWLNSSMAATMVTIAGLLFLVAFVFSKNN